MSGWRPALRIARRSVRRHLGRSVLIAALIAVPITGATLIDVLVRTTSGPVVDAYRTMGTADGIADVTSRPALSGWRPYPHGSVWSVDERAETRDPATADLAGLLPAGSRIVPAPVSYHLRLANGDRTVRTDLAVGPVGDPLVEHEIRLRSGRPPAAPDQVLVTEPLANRLGLLEDGQLRPGAELAVADGPTAAVTGIAVRPQCLDCESVAAVPGSAVARSVGGGDADGWYHGAPDIPNSLRFMVDLPDGADAEALIPALAERHGVAFTPRAVYLHPERYDAGSPVDTYAIQVAGLIALIATFGLLEVVLLAGAAFAVGARRQVRELGLIAANGGTAGQIRRTVLAQGVVLGVLGAATGIITGGLLAVLGKPLWQRFGNQLIEGWRFGTADLAIVAAVGVLSGLAAALLPAIGASRMTPVDALAQRFWVPPGRVRRPVAGLALLAGGAATALLATAATWPRLDDYARELEERAGEGVWVQQPDLTLPTGGMVAGALAAVAGLIMVMPALVAALAGLGRRLPLSGRLAVRDANRRRHRTTPATVAIMIVVATTVLLACVAANDELAWELRQTPSLPDRVLLVSAGDLSTDPDAAATMVQAGEAAAAALPGGASHPVQQPSTGETSGYGPGLLGVDPSPCFEDSGGSYAAGQIGIATKPLIELAMDARPAPALLRALDQGEIVVFDQCLLSPAGTVQVSSDWTAADSTTLPAFVAEREIYYTSLPGAFISARTAAEHGWRSVTTAAAVGYRSSATADDIDTALGAAEHLGAFANVEGEHNRDSTAARPGSAWPPRPGWSPCSVWA